MTFLLGVIFARLLKHIVPVTKLIARKVAFIPLAESANGPSVPSTVTDIRWGKRFRNSLYGVNQIHIAILSMKTRWMLRMALGLSACSIALNIEQYLSFRARVIEVVGIREQNDARRFIEKLNYVREAMGEPPVAPTNLIGALTYYMEEAANVIDGKIGATTNETSNPKTNAVKK